MPAQPDYLAFFRRYADAYEKSLGDTIEVETIRSFFAEEFMGLSIAGGINAGKNDETFIQALQQGYAYYKAIGTVGMRAESVDVMELAQNHDRVRVFYSARYRRRSGEELTISFDVTYLLQRQEHGPKIFAFISGDELGTYRAHGLVDDQGNPA
jgi:hypothetical protein